MGGGGAGANSFYLAAWNEKSTAVEWSYCHVHNVTYLWTTKQSMYIVACGIFIIHFLSMVSKKRNGVNDVFQHQTNIDKHEQTTGHLELHVSHFSK